MLDDPDYARRGLEDYATSIKFAIPALLGFLTVPILGPFLALVVIGAGFVRVSSLERLARAGAMRTWRLRGLFRSARTMAWFCAILGSAMTALLLHDSFGRWGAIAPPMVALVLARVWTLAVCVEVLVAGVLLHRSARILDVGWLRASAQVSLLLVAGGMAVRLLLMALGAAIQPAGVALGALALVVATAWISAIIGCWLIGAGITALAGAVTELHRLSGEVAADDESSRPDAGAPAALATPPASGGPRAAGPRDDEPIPLD